MDGYDNEEEYFHENTFFEEKNNINDVVSEFIEVPDNVFLPNNGVLKYLYHSESTENFTHELQKLEMEEKLYKLNKLNESCILDNKIQDSLIDTDVRIPGAPPCRLVNLVCTYNTRLNLNPTKIAFVYKHIVPIKYNLQGFAALIFSVKMHGIPTTTILLYPSGNVVLTGARSIVHARLSAWKLAEFFHQHLHIPISIRFFKVNNIVSNLDLPFPVKLEPLNKSLGVLSSYQPEKIQCVFIRGKKDRHLVVLVYASGSVVITGCRTMEDVENQIKYIMETITEFKDTKNKNSITSRHLHKKKGYEVPKITGKKRILENGEDTTGKPANTPIDPFRYAFKTHSFLPIEYNI